jgi:hypothetical protein
MDCTAFQERVLAALDMQNEDELSPERIDYLWQARGMDSFINE